MQGNAGGAPSQATRGAAPGYRPDIDGLRAIAVTSVVLFHAGVWPLHSGYVGVDIFFVISGFLIGGIIYREAACGQFSFAGFYARRARRILPALFLVLLFTLLAGMLLLSPEELSRLGRSAGSAILAVSNIHFWLATDYFAPDARLDPLLMTWSLGIEEQFYLLFPLVLLALRRYGGRADLLALAALSLLSLALSVLLTARDPTAAFYLLPSRAWELGAGAWLAVWQARGGALPQRLAEPTSLAGLLAIAASLVLYDEHTLFPGLAALLPVLGTLALIAAGGSRLNRRLLGHRLPVGIGRISYSWYLWHWPLMSYARLCSFQPPSVSVLLLMALISLLLALVSWRWVEQPFRHPGRSDRATNIRYALAAAALLLLPLSIQLSDGLPARLSPRVSAIEQAASQGKSDPCLARQGRDSPNQSPACIATRPGQPAVAIVGDSHAAALSLGLRALAEQQGWGFQVMTKSSCRPLRGVTVWKRDQPAFAEDCARYMAAAFGQLVTDPSVRSVILAGLWAGPLNDLRRERYHDPAEPGSEQSGLALLDRGLHAAVRELQAAGKQVFLVEDVPYWSFDPVPAAIIQEIPARLALQQRLEPGLIFAAGAGPVFPRQPQVDQLLRDLAAQSGAHWLPTVSAFCADGSCRFREGEELLYVDRSHLSRQGALRALLPSAARLFAPDSGSPLQ